MKKIIIAVCLLFLLISSEIAFAADALYRMLHADEIQSFKKDQDAMIVGQLIDKQRDKFTVKVLKVISGKVKSDTILVPDDFNYGWGQTELTPAVNDFCVMSLKRSGNYYKKAWGIFKADSGDYKTLKLTTKNVPSSGLMGDFACIEWYVNSGGAENDFFFNSGTAYAIRPNGQSTQIYPKSTTDADTTTTSGATQAQEITIAKDETSDVDSSSKLSSFLIVVIIMIGIIAVVYLKPREKVK